MRLTGVHACTRGRHSDMLCAYAPSRVEGLSRCMCKGYPATTVQGDCTVCGAGYYETNGEWVNAVAQSGGIGEEFPVTLMVYTENEKQVGITDVREDSITMEVRKGIPTLVAESFDSGRIAYIPHAVWYTTEVQG